MSYSFESHITIDCVDSRQYCVLLNECAKIGAKVVAIDLEENNKFLNGDKSSRQIMTSKTFKADTYEEMRDIVEADYKAIHDNYLFVKRIKIESDPFFVKDTNYPYEYVEIHVPCKINKIGDHKSLTMNWYRSKNAFKDNIIMLTCRVSCDSMIPTIDENINTMKKLGWIDKKFKHHYEYAIYDTNTDLDKHWLNYRR